MRYRAITLSIIAAWLVGCGGDDNLVASYSIGKDVALRLELKPIHPFLAEYERIAVLQGSDGSTVRQKLALDTGGYSATNLYQCGPARFMLKGYFDNWLIDTAAGTVRSGACDSPVYIGIFEGKGREPWRFHSSQQRPEKALIPSGG
ncbi:hypothetical protein AvCA_00760 [Azotobacter vinelandii CA]|uniref:Lipoprotein n=2 Tax=Azotobacter vinelandii TaxID=354 RepID=C1DG16_AZOVD|nr:hypothetical protein [Azotobacter vinelandii]ACO76343.1 hypothetical protein Avin_00760 [Azotobacter vinelandii DJ]AGK17442.1 hypothetical protein AvCA_00760 [Azotobacter vinelandii CA]AGK19055.1 hypothetical protein AvCA6_00760 [Azotobacter vinelandii CA6]SFY23986.1 hypothetical protein SAMN04244547_04642 [Azotobacter vinelandii]GLK58190.1 hypothetical protein GCM10017624_03470 [Azotobacter vinelandii]